MKQLYLVAFKGYAYVMAESEQEAIQVGLETASTNGCAPWATKATGCFPEYKSRQPVEGDGRTIAVVLKDEGYSVK